MNESSVARRMWLRMWHFSLLAVVRFKLERAVARQTVFSRAPAEPQIALRFDGSIAHKKSDHIEVVASNSV